MPPILACWLATLVSLAPVPEDLCLGKDHSTGEERPCQRAIMSAIDQAAHCVHCLRSEPGGAVVRVSLVAE